MPVGNSPRRLFCGPKLYTVYSLPNHRDGIVHQTGVEAEAVSEHSDGKTTEYSGLLSSLRFLL